jgi:hypothetical protein
MKKLALAFIALISASAMSAQTTPADRDTTTIDFGKTQVIILSTPTNDSLSSDSVNITPPDFKSELTHWAGLDLGVNFLLNSDNKTTLAQNDEWLELDQARSLSWRINFYEEKIRIIKDYVGITTGLGLSWNSYTFNNNVNLNVTSDSTFGVIDSLPEYSKNKLRATYLHLPVMLEFNTSRNPDKSFHLAAGVVGGWKIGSIHKQEFELDGQNYKVRVKDNFNLSPLTLDLTARVGYKNFTVWATYGLTPLFKDNKGPEVFPVSLGITLIPFG